jgi:hypothetical protein
MVLYDDRCVWHIAPRETPSVADSVDTPLSFRGSPVVARASRHEGSVVAPDGESRPAAPIAVTLIASDERPFFLLSLMRVWLQRPDIQEDDERDAWLTRVALHEMVHTLHLHHVASRVARLAEKGPLPAHVSDDIIEDRFKDDAAYAKTFFEERDLLYRAARSANDAEARQLATKALALASARKATYFRGDQALLGDLEDVFLTMEGIAEWFAFRAIPRGADAEAAALAASHANLKNSWSQAEGLVLFLLIERFAPDGWQSRSLSVDAPSPFDLLGQGLR